MNEIKMFAELVFTVGGCVGIIFGVLGLFFAGMQFLIWLSKKGSIYKSQVSFN